MVHYNFLECNQIKLNVNGLKLNTLGVFDQGQEQVRTTDEPPASTQCPAAATAEWLLTSNPSNICLGAFMYTNCTNYSQT